MLGTLESIVAISTIISNVAVVATLLIYSRQLKKATESNEIQRESVQIDMDNRKKDTIEFYNATLGPLSRCRTLINNTFPNECVNPSDPRYKKPSIQKAVVQFLNVSGRMAVGIKHGIYDFDTFVDITGAETSHTFKQLYPVILEKRQHEYDAFTILEALVLKYDCQSGMECLCNKY